jgi:hypothetical protein
MLTTQRHGFSLLEVLLLTLVLGVGSVGASLVIRPEPLLGSVRADAETNHLATVLRSTRHTAIVTGMPHRLRFVRTRTAYDRYVVERFDGQAYSAISPPSPLPSSLRLRPSNPSVEFSALGETTSNWNLQVDSNDELRAIQINATGGLTQHTTLDSE